MAGPTGARTIHRSHSDTSEGTRRSPGVSNEPLRSAHSALLRCRLGLYSEAVPIFFRSLLVSFAYPRFLSTCRQSFPQSFKTFPFGTSLTGHPDFLYGTSTSSETPVSLVDAYSFHPWSSLFLCLVSQPLCQRARIYPLLRAHLLGGKEADCPWQLGTLRDGVVRLGLRRPIRVLVGMNPTAGRRSR